VTAIRSMTRKADEARIRQETAAAIRGLYRAGDQVPTRQGERRDGQGEATHQAALHPPEPRAGMNDDARRQLSIATSLSA
jgi:hypothetical protein